MGDYVCVPAVFGCVCTCGMRVCVLWVEDVCECDSTDKT